MLFYEEFIEKRDMELMGQYRHSPDKDIMSYEEFVDEQYQAYVHACLKIYREDNNGMPIKIAKAEPVSTRSPLFIPF